MEIGEHARRKIADEHVAQRAAPPSAVNTAISSTPKISVPRSTATIAPDTAKAAVPTASQKLKIPLISVIFFSSNILNSFFGGFARQRAPPRRRERLGQLRPRLHARREQHAAVGQAARRRLLVNPDAPGQKRLLAGRAPLRCPLPSVSQTASSAKSFGQTDSSNSRFVSPVSACL